MASSVLMMIKEEVTCPICLELLKEPVIADCDHSFCRACITLNYESSKVNEGEGICPVCRVTYMFGNLRPNRHVANIVERLKGFKSSPEEEQKLTVCAQHGEKLQLFCEKDMVAICWLCERSQDHHGHQTALIEEVALKYSGKLQAALQTQMANEKRCDEWEDYLQKERTYWEAIPSGQSEFLSPFLCLKNQIHSEEENVQMAFEGLWEFLDSKKKSELQKLMKEKEDVMNSLAESQNELEKQREAVRDLISDMQHHLHFPTIEMLQGVKSVLTRSQTLRVTLPTMIPRKQRSIFRAPDVKGMLQVFQGLMDAQRHWVPVTLRQGYNNNVLIDMEKRQIQYLNNYGRKLQDNETFALGVLGYPAFQSGKYYWEVDVSRSDAWLLGLNDGRCAQPQLHSMNQMGIMYNSHDKQHVNFQPKYGYWVIGKKNKSVYNAFVECSVTHNASVLALSLTHPPNRVGVFLDREACTLSFYDVSNHGALIYKFCDPSFPNTVYPYFNPMETSQPMTVCGPPS
ncbi:Tripartite motif-containing protein 30 [Cricetulus griseus]|uniref:Tripartite motif-containing protein 30 n=1 Tax=Cricetulus griseus TaxID=10029 RepID=G3IDI0_CRIGR|nr:Tripartite motif-containing protein 30 [Cricetulus griseus]